MQHPGTIAAIVILNCMCKFETQEQAAKRDALIRDVQEALQDMADARQSLASAQFEKSQIQVNESVRVSQRLRVVASLMRKG